MKHYSFIAFGIITISIMLPGLVMPYSNNDFASDYKKLAKRLATLSLTVEQNFITRFEQAATNTTTRAKQYAERIKSDFSCQVTTFKKFKYLSEQEDLLSISALVKMYFEANKQANNEQSELNTLIAQCAEIDDEDTKTTALSSVQKLREYLIPLVVKIQEYLSPFLPVGANEADYQALADEDGTINALLAPITNNSFFIKQSAVVLDGNVLPLTTYTAAMFIKDFGSNKLKDTITTAYQAFADVQTKIDQSRLTQSVQKRWRQQRIEAIKLFLASGITIARTRFLANEMATTLTQATNVKTATADLEKSIIPALQEVQKYSTDIPQIKTTAEIIKLREAFNTYYSAQSNISYNHEQEMQRIGLMEASQESASTS